MGWLKRTWHQDVNLYAQTDSDFITDKSIHVCTSRFKKFVCATWLRFYQVNLYAQADSRDLTEVNLYA